MKFGVILLALIISFNSAVAKKKEVKGFKKLETKRPKKHIVKDLDREIKRTNRFDRDIDQMIQGTLGDRYRRANVFDFYPIEIPRRKSRYLSHDEEVELMDYYNYARNDLEKISQSKLLKVVKLDLDKDKDWDYAVVVHDKKKKRNYLSVINFKEKLYLEPFQADFVEMVNAGKYPTTVVYGRKKKTLKAPALRIVDFNDESQILYFDHSQKDWELLSLGDD